jgi:hypothetical protein
MSTGHGNNAMPHNERSHTMDNIEQYEQQINDKSDIEIIADIKNKMYFLLNMQDKES